MVTRYTHDEYGDLIEATDGEFVEFTELSHAQARIAELEAERDRLRDALHEISLCSQNPMSSKDECGRIARTALGGGSDEV